MANPDEYPWWLQWVVPVVTILGAVGTLVVWLTRTILFSFVKVEFQKMLDKKFEEHSKEDDQRNEHIEQRLEDQDKERQKIAEDVSQLQSDVSYLRGRAEGDR